jgi:hypothetical protein
MSSTVSMLFRWVKYCQHSVFTHPQHFFFKPFLKSSFLMFTNKHCIFSHNGTVMLIKVWSMQVMYVKQVHSCQTEALNCDANPYRANAAVYCVCNSQYTLLLRMKGQLSNPYRITGKIMVVCILIFRSWDRRQTFSRLIIL